MKKIFLGILSLAFVMVSCNSDDDNNTQTTSNLTLNLNGLEDLGSDFTYEGWLLVDGTPVSTGVFTVDANGQLSATTFAVPTETINSATKFILTIEPNPDPNPEPSDQKLIAGDFNGNSASVSTATAPAVGDFGASAGNFFLRTPTDEQSGTGNNGNDQYGVWFGTPGMPPAATLELPELPVGWIYEGWVIGDAGPLSTGTFSNVDEMDDNAGLSTSFGGTENAGPPIPGEDFFNNAPTGETFPLDIRGRTIVITVEPVPDNSPLPFTLKPLAAQAGNDTAPAFYDFALNLGTFPTGTVTR
ncbi:MAG: anti-sigma factor [Bacteroidota bacterium]